MHCMDGNNINMIRGDTIRLDIEITTADGNPYILKDGDKLLFTVKKNVFDKDIIIQKKITSGTIVIDHQDTADLEYRSYVYDVQLTLANGDVCTVIPPSELFVGYEVTFDG